MSNIYYRYLNLPCSFIDEEKITKEYSSMSNFDPNKNGQWRIEGINPDIFNEQSYEWLSQFNCHAGVAEIFYTAPHSKISYHVDYSGFSPVFDYIKFNFVWGPKELHYMKWGEPKSGLSNEVSYTNSCGSPYISYKIDEIDEKESVCITQPILVNVGRPHTAINDSDIGRWCLCLIPKKNTGVRIDFTEAIELFKDYIL